MDALRDNTLVVFAGAGVSKGKPACLPDFKQLAWEIASGTGAEPRKGESEDRFLGRLRQENGTNVHVLAAKALSRDGLKPTELHFSLVWLFSRLQSVRLVTTNFDELFEQAAETEDLLDANPDLFRAPALPMGHDFSGIVHVHGAVSHPHEMVLTDEDFGRAYLTEGWARRFLISLFRQYTVLFVGYSHNDTDMHYLARALPASETKRYALIESGSDDAQRWQALKVEAISYPESSDHRALYVGIERLANTVNRGVLDWEREISYLAQRPPPLGGEEEDTIEEALSDDGKIEFFTKHASSPEWISWLDGRNHLDALFKSENTLNNRESTLSRWLAQKFVCTSADELFLLIGRHSMRLHPHFWSQLGWQVRQNEAGTLNANGLSRWVSVLLAAIPANANVDRFVLYDLGTQCANHQLFNSLLQVFEAMTAGRLTLKPGLSWNDDEEARIDLKLPLVSESHYLWELWENTLKPNLSQVAEPLLKLVIRRLVEQYQSSCAWQKANREWDSASWGRSAIEPHEQDSFRDPIDVLIDTGRDCLKWLAENQENAASHWCDQLVAADAPLLRRLAVYTVSARLDLTAVDKVDWLLTHDILHDSAAQHEVFQLARQAYPAASKEKRADLIAAVHAYRWRDDEEPDKEGYNARRQLNWFAWLHEAAPNCPLAQKALDDVTKQVPGYKPGKYLDLLSYSEGWDGPKSPWSTEELLSKPASEWLDELLAFRSSETHRFEYERSELLQEVTEAARQQFDWGVELVEALIGIGKWDVDLWPNLMHAWQDMELSEEEFGEILSCLDRAELFEEHALEIARVLFALVKNKGKPYALSLLPHANVLANALWKSLDSEVVEVENHRWLNKALGHPAGELSLFWLNGLSVWRNAQDPTPKSLTDEFRPALSAIMDNSASPGRLGRSVLASDLAFLLTVDEAWTRHNLLPLFASDSNDFYVVWDGFLTRGRLYPAVAECMEQVFLQAVEPLAYIEFARRKRFIGYYTSMLAYHAENPVEVWIPRLFQYGGQDVGEVLTSSISDHIRRLNEATQTEWWQRWLRRYWKNRLHGVPVALAPGEVAHMLHWPTHLTEVFPEAVALALKLNPTPLEHGWMIRELKESNLPQRHPEEVAQLLLHYEKFNLPGHTWYDALELMNKLLDSSISDDLKYSLRELRARKGFENRDS